MKIIDIEGTDGSGKKMQTKLLYEYLTTKGYKCKILSFPNYENEGCGPVKMYLNGSLGDNDSLTGYQASSLYAVDRFTTLKQLNLAEYDFVLMDRYTCSNMIHQSTRFKSDEEVDKFLDWVKEFEYGLLNLPEPDYTLFLDVPSEISFKLTSMRKQLKNGQNKDILEQDYNHLLHAYNRAKYVAHKFNWHTINCVADGKILSKAEIQIEILKVLNNLKAI